MPRPVPQVTSVSSTIGRQEVLCFEVRSPDTNGTVYWQAGGPSGERVHALKMPIENCNECDCVEDTLLPAVMESRAQLPHYSAFFAPVFVGFDDTCLPDVSNRVLSILLIDAITPTDSGNYTLTIFSISDVKNEESLQYSVNASEFSSCTLVWFFLLWKCAQVLCH